MHILTSRQTGRLTAVVLCTAAVVLACNKSSPNEPGGQPTISSYVSGLVTPGGVQATLANGAAPSAAGGPAVNVSANSTVINGGSTVTRLTAASSFQNVYLFVTGSTGHWILRLPTAVNDLLIVVSFGNQIPQSSFDIAYAVATASGPVGAYTGVRTTVNATAATGVVQVSASWNALSDVDLHVVDPRGEEIYYANDVSSSGGRLDLDSNAACGIDGINNENIRWTTSPPAGTYTVRLDYWDSCSVAATNYVVTVNNGGSSQVFTGTFTGLGDRGGEGSGRFITTFSRAASASSDAPLAPLPSLFTPSALKKRLSSGR